MSYEWTGDIELSAVKRRLEALGCPFHQTYDGNTDDRAFLRVLSWLEDRFIRIWDPAERNVLRNAPVDTRGLEKYLGDLDCPEELFDAGARDKLVEWLIQESIWRQEGEETQKYHTLDHENLQSIRKSLTKLCEALGLPTPTPDNALTEVSASIRRAVMARRSRERGDRVQYRLDLDQISPDLVRVRAADDEAFRNVSKVAQVLNHVYLSDLRNLQTEINTSLEIVQGITADLSSSAKVPDG
mmetsp:Transcript_4976/g.6935  ORF Transcript_4976/g.6935 Transcript_4976/m.6935 type:complete len:242 (-) Transcript_4976:909-1634(-)|eukprot:CAMPEP_0184739472 /NCGR_PEP_ID=MMETSP0315-20130426/2377_1 /TAXON_ID=101924 /ORGANISM="Rhodosorus marinus, Strain UTEX LB 2760" /LENGTH=241 /DNA_ID=CAMNT_0027208349 /DNA_START=29 /DNA_END=754 /DNA_ORIENTATION=+